MNNLKGVVELDCGAILPNHIAKAAMTEGLADQFNYATEAHRRLYERWAQGGAGLLLTGNVQIDPDHLERPGNIVINGDQNKQQLDRLRQMAVAGKSRGGHIWMQISHAGRQTQTIVNSEPLAPSSVPLNMPKGQFGMPRAMSEGQILEVIEGFAHAASIAKQTGFSGVQIHSAHGYLLSSFLSPLANRRTDRWGGALENRARALLECVRAVRKKVGALFPISVKLNSADFQDNGFSHSDSLQVARWLDEEGVDLLEISGGNYESAAMMGAHRNANQSENGQKKESTRRREAYFLDYAKDIRKAVSMGLMVTGGFRSREVMEEAVNEGSVDMIGLARPLCTQTDLPKRLLDEQVERASEWEHKLVWKNLQSIELMRLANAWGTQGWFCLQLIRMGAGLEPNLKMGVMGALLRYLSHETRAAKAMKKARLKAR